MVSLLDNTLLDANDLGTLTTLQVIPGSFDSTDKVAYYKFVITQNSDVIVQLPGEFIDTRLIADLNNNGIDESNEYIANLTSSSNQFFIEPLPAGTYYIRMITTSNRLTEYSLRLSATPKPGNLPSDPGGTFGSAFNLGTLSKRRTLADYIGDVDPIDMYKFTLTQTTNIGFFLSGETETTRIFIAADENGNGVYDLGETINSRRGSETEFSTTLLPGTYFIQAGISSPIRSTQYVITLNPVPDLSGDDVLRGTSRADRLRGLGGNDTIYGFSNDDRLFGGSGDDRLLGGAGNDRLAGDGGNDRLVGDIGNDVLIGGAGNDYLDGGAGSDVITGGTGRDRIVLRSGQGFDRLVDYQDNVDKIDLVGISFGQLTIRQLRDDVLVKLGSTNLLLIENTDVNVINRLDFV